MKNTTVSTMIKEKAIWLVGCAVGAGLMGFFSNKLDTHLGITLFVIGLGMLCISLCNTEKTKKQS